MKLNTPFLLTAWLSVGSHLAQGAAVQRRADVTKEIAPKYFADLGAKRVKVRHGPFKVPAITDPETKGMKSFPGLHTMPCSDCFITGYQGGIEYADGSEANANTGMWLHHTIFINANRSDSTCSSFPERFIGSGNERTPIDLTAKGTRKTGYRVLPGDLFATSPEMMNEWDEAREVYITDEWEYIPASTAGFQHVTPIWLDVAGVCSRTASFEVPANTTKFVKSMEPDYEFKFDAEILFVFGHLHDGGLNLDTSKNGAIACSQVAQYGETEGFITHVGDHEHEDEEHEHEHEEPGHEHEPEKPEHEHGPEEPGHKHEPEKPEHKHEPEEPAHDHPHKRQHDHSTGEHIAHISSMGACDTIKVTKGDKISLKASYDLTDHTAMAGHHGGLEPIMGIALNYVLGAPAPVQKSVGFNYGTNSVLETE